MPRFFIDTQNGEVVARDRDGYSLPDLLTAREMAVRALRDMATDELPGGDCRSFRAIVRDEDGSPLYSAALTFEGHWEEPASPNPLTS